MLHVLLNDDITFQDASKETFLAKLEDVFSKLKTEGDSFLQFHTGICKSDDCENKGCKGFSFIGDKSKNYIDLIFSETEDDFTDIYYCHEFQTDDKSAEKDSSVPIEIKKDETLGFVPTIDYLLKSQNCALAIEELMNFEDQIIGTEIYLPWLQKHKGLFDSIELFESIFYVALNKFPNLYRRLQDLKDYLSFRSLAQKAVEDFGTIDKYDETSQLKWLVEYENLGSKLTLFMYDERSTKHRNNSAYFKIDFLKISSDDFGFIIKFKSIFEEHYWDMLEKYSVFTEEEGIEYRSAYPEHADDTILLSYSLRKRGIIE